MMWISLLLIGLVSTIIPPATAAAAAAVQKGGIGSAEYGFVQRSRMLRADVKKQQQKEQEEIDVDEVVVVEEEEKDNDNEDEEEEADVLPILEDVDALGLDTSRTTNSTEEAYGGNETAAVEDNEEELVEVVNLLETSKDVTPIKLPSFSFKITADPDTDNIALSGLSSVLSDYLLEELQEKLPKTTLTSVDLDVNYEYKPEKSEVVGGVGFDADEEDSVHIFTAQGTVFVNNSGIVIPSESKVFAKTRDSLSSKDAGEEIVTLLQESDEKSLQAAKTFSLSDLTPIETASLVNPSYSVPRTLDIFIGLTAVLVLLAGAYVARDKARSSEQPDDEYDIEEVRTVKMKEAVDEEETLPPTPPTTPYTTPSSPSDRKSSPQIIALSDFNIFDEFSHLGDDNTATTKEQTTRESILKNSAAGRDDSSGIAPFPTRAVSYQDGVSTSASTRKTSSQLLSLSDFNILDEFMCHGGFAGETATRTTTVDESRHVTFKDDETDTQTNSTSEETQQYESFLDGCGAIEMADGVKIDNSAMQAQKKQSRKEDNSDADCGLMDVVDIGVEDLDICGNNDYDGETTYRDETISYFSDDTDNTDLTY
jgi:hypothetical protein